MTWYVAASRCGPTAGQAGIKLGDTVTAVDDAPITTREEPWSHDVAMTANQLNSRGLHGGPAQGLGSVLLVVHAGGDRG